MHNANKKQVTQEKKLGKILNNSVINKVKAVNEKDSLSDSQILFPGEKKLFEISGNAYTLSSNPLQKFISSIFAIIMKIFGLSLKTFIIVTNSRVIRVDKRKTFWIIPRSTSVMTISKGSIFQIGYQQEVRWFIFKTTYFVVQTVNSSTLIAYKGDNVNKDIARMTKIIL